MQEEVQFWMVWSWKIWGREIVRRLVFKFLQQIQMEIVQLLKIALFMIVGDSACMLNLLTMLFWMLMSFIVLLNTIYLMQIIVIGRLQIICLC